VDDADAHEIAGRHRDRRVETGNLPVKRRAGVSRHSAKDEEERLSFQAGDARATSTSS